MAVTLDRALREVDDYALKYRGPNLKPFEISGVYDLFPRQSSGGIDVETTWPDAFPRSDRQGVYLILNECTELLYVGKASNRNAMGARLGSYFGYVKETRDCMIYNEQSWCGLRPRFVVTIAVPEETPFEAAALEEYLIGKLDPPSNTVGRRLKGTGGD